MTKAHSCWKKRYERAKSSLLGLAALDVANRYLDEELCVQVSYWERDGKVFARAVLPNGDVKEEFGEGPLTLAVGQKVTESLLSKLKISETKLQKHI